MRLRNGAKQFPAGCGRWMRAARSRRSNYGAIWRVTSPPKDESVFAEDVLDHFVQLPRRRQRQVGRLARQLANQPFVLGDYATLDDQGRRMGHLLIGDFVFSYWLDHANREVRIVEIADAS